VVDIAFLGGVVPRSGIVVRNIRLRQYCFALFFAAVAALVSGCATLSHDEAKSILASDSSLQKIIILDLGYLNGHCGQSPSLPKYAVLEKAGIISIGNTSTSTEVLTTNKGDDVFKRVGARRIDSSTFKMQTGMSNCNLRNWAIPIATKEMKDDLTVTPAGDNGADVVYNWTWKPNEIGENFAIDSKVYKSLNRHAQESLADGELPFDNSFPHASKVHFYHDGAGWHIDNKK
jgi:hypothetical protein